MFIFKRTGTTWDFQQEIVFDSNFGNSVDIDGNTIIVSNEGNYDGYENTVSFVEYDGSTWSRTETFVTFYAPSFGHVAISGDLALAYGEIDNNTPITRTYLRSGGVWSEQDSLPAGGYDISGNTAVINRDVYVAYIASGTVWALVTTLVPDEPFSASGNSVAIQSNRIVVADSDKSFVFSRTGSAWTQQQKLTVDGGNIGSSGSRSIAVSGAFVLVAPYVFDLNDAPEPQNLLFNGDFEINVDNDVTVPDGWTRKNTTIDERRCNKPGLTPVAYSGNCSYIFRQGTNGRLAQNIDLNVHSLNAGDTIRLTGYYQKESSDGDVNVWVFVSYSDQPKQQAKITVRQATSGYKALPPINITLNGTPTRVRVMIENKITYTRMWIDTLSLQKTASGGGSTTSDSGNLLPLALPALPEIESDNSRALPLPLP